MARSLRIALPKGRMSEESLDHLRACGLTSLTSFPDDRRLIFPDEESGVEFLLIRSRDVGTYVEMGSADIGIMGTDLLEEHQFRIPIALPLPFGQCRLSVAYPEGQETWLKRRNVRVATKYPNLAAAYFYQRGYNIELIHLYGSIEIAPLTGLSDVIVDLVSTGATLKANRLREEQTILQSQANLIVNRSSYVFHRARLSEIIDRLSA